MNRKLLRGYCALTIERRSTRVC